MSDTDPEDGSWVVDQLNRDAVARSAYIARSVSNVLVVVGCLGGALWAWYTYRTQEHATSFSVFVLSPGAGESDASIAERLDLFAGTFSLAVSSSFVIGIALLLRVAADYMEARVGGDVTGYRRAEAEMFDGFDPPPHEPN